MKFRKIKLPEDFDVIQDIIAESFHYPENPDWNIQEDEKEGFIDSIRSLKKIWPLINFIGLFSKTVKQLLMGYIVEIDGKPSGLFIFQRRGTTNKWYISTVGVKPEFRRRGIARKLVEKGIDSIRELDGEIVFLDVISGNHPAYSLYVDVGFEHYSGVNDMVLKDREPIPEPVILDEYKLQKISLNDWKPRFKLMELITPDYVKEYEPIEVGRFKRPFFVRLIMPLIMFAQGAKETDLIIIHQDEIIGRMNIQIDTKKGRHGVLLYLDEAHAAISDVCVQYMLNKVGEFEDKKAINANVFAWNEHVLKSFEKFGFIKKLEMHRLGLILKEDK